MQMQFNFVSLLHPLSNPNLVGTSLLAQRDDPTFGRYLVRRARRETFSLGKRAEAFLDENFYIISGFSGGILVTSIIS